MIYSLLTCPLDQGDEEAIRLEQAGEKAQRSLGGERGLEAFRASGSENAFDKQGFDAGLERKLAGIGGSRQHRGNDLLVLLRLQRTGRVDNTPSGTNGAQSSRKDRSLAFSLTSEIGQVQPVANLRIAAQRAGATARHVGQDKIISRRSSVSALHRRGGIRRDPPSGARRFVICSNLAALDSQATMRACGVALGQNQRLASGRGASVEDAVSLPDSPLANLGHQLRAFVLEAHAALAEMPRSP